MTNFHDTPYNVPTTQEFSAIFRKFTQSVGPNGRVHCPKDSPLNRARGKKITYMNGHLYCNIIMLNEIKSIVDFEEQTTTFVTQHPGSRMRFKSKDKITASQLSLVINSL